jgi:hypothetical protein
LVKIREPVDGKSQRKARAKYEASRNLGEQLLAAAREIKAGNAARVQRGVALRDDRNQCAPEV